MRGSKQLTESSIFRSQPLCILVGSEQIRLSIHSAVVERFPQPLREDLDIPGRIQGEEPIVVRNIDLDTFALYCDSQVSLRLEEANAQAFDGPFAVVVPKHPRESRTLLPTLFIHSWIYIHAAKYKWESLKLLSFQKFQNALETSPLTAALIDELAPMFCFISEQESEAARNLARYVTGYVTTTIGPLQETSSFRDFAEWAQFKD
ncbi:uncharacterized protein NFIA_112420 [Aspergillus fischeri NRRL 181]|uniref:BTB domain-containing protein n=1 Tax=Neosartorya fischeri (strain ATCC 1020 / DSM 3700 / CBS 544.65 / FGSC A1164 / JCM 1740 / NRRL 181 / WB 181) TaxID=331117 RepID=A1D8K7_NEOFI|nr:uncharacterized protein NFIA_112420 [Aspergillus fischeri NRRL 181]EAW20718.1 hypothetical protein NFIA_112420 [Aspergillus fischeri NRRL 181]